MTVPKQEWFGIDGVVKYGKDWNKISLSVLAVLFVISNSVFQYLGMDDKDQYLEEIVKLRNEMTKPIEDLPVKIPVVEVKKKPMYESSDYMLNRFDDLTTRLMDLEDAPKVLPHIRSPEDDNRVSVYIAVSLAQKSMSESIDIYKFLYYSSEEPYKNKIKKKVIKLEKASKKLIAYRKHLYKKSTEIDKKVILNIYEFVNDVYGDKELK